MTQSAVAQILGLTRRPARQVLLAPEREGLSAEQDTGGYVVRSFTIEEIIDVIGVRGLLEGLAARQLVYRGVPRR